MKFPTFYFGLDNVVVKNATDVYGVPGNDVSNPLKEAGTSSFGMPLYSNIKFKAADYTDSAGTNRQFNELTFNTVILTVSQSKNIITTEIQGRDGTVKEYIGKGDYEVKINGYITSDKNGIYPLTDVNDLKNMLDAPMAISVTSWYLQLFDIFYLVVKDYELPQMEGYGSEQPFTITAISDTPGLITQQHV